MAVTGALALLPLDASAYVAHPLHDPERDWPETNCYVDLWIELLGSLGLDPVAGLAMTLAAGFDGDQWDFFKYESEDLRTLYGIEVHEINVWRPVHEHIELHLRAGNLLTVEVDSFHLPDTAGVSYGIQHQKTTIVPQMLDMRGRRMGYFHNAGYFEVDGDDVDGLLRTGAVAPEVLPPYVELIDLRGVVRRDPADLRAASATLAARHFARRRPGNPLRELADGVARDVPWLREHPDMFHAYAFGTLRQCGSWAAMAAAHLEWSGGAAATAAPDLEAIASSAKTAQFKLARVVNGRSVDLDEVFGGMIEHWAAAEKVLADVYAG